METVGIVTGGHQQRRRGVGSDAEEAEKVGCGGHQQRLDLVLELGDL
jgi:hypothetical protein